MTPAFRRSCCNAAAFLLLALAILLLPACERAPDTARALRIGNHAEPSSLDPHRSEDVPARNIQRDLFEGLTVTDAGGGPIPGVAHDWSSDDDLRVWTFRLREEARWSNGDPVTAYDFVFSLRRAVTPGTGGIVSETLLPIRNAAAILRGELPPEQLGVSAPDPQTLIIELESPTPYFLATLTHPSTFPVHPPTVIAEGDNWARPGTLVSNGAYKLAEWVVNSHIALEKNPHYREADQVAIERVEYLSIENQQAELARFEAGDLHITYGAPSGRLDWLRSKFGDALRVHPWFGVYYLGLNTTRPPLDDVRVRCALTLVIDRDRIANDVVGNGEQPTANWIPAINGYEPPQPDWLQQPLPERIARARELLAAAGYDAERPLELELLYNVRDRDQRIVTAVASIWREHLPVQTKLVNQEWKVYLQTRRQLAKTQVFRSGWVGDYPDPNSFAEILHSAHGMNDTGWSNPRYDALLERATNAADRGQRYALLRAAEQEILQDVPLIPLFRYSTVRLVSPQLQGYSDNLMNHHYSRHLSWRQEN